MVTGALYIQLLLLAIALLWGGQGQHEDEVTMTTYLLFIFAAGSEGIVLLGVVCG